MNHERYLDILVDNKLFKGIDRKSISSIIDKLDVSISKYDKKDFIAIEGDYLKGVGVVIKGGVLINKTNEAGTSNVVAKFKEGDIFGELASFGKLKKWPASVIASFNDTVIMFIEPSSIVRLYHNNMKESMQLIENLLALISSKAIILNRKLEYMSLKSMRSKIAKYLLSNKNSGNNFNVNLNRGEMASFLGVSRSSMSRELSRMKKDNIIDYYKQSFKITDIEKLKDCLQ